MKPIQNIGIFTSGGDAPGMNACIRSVVRTASYYNIQVTGINNGYAGMIDGDFISLESEDVSGIVNRGGTILFSSRSEEFRTKEGRAKAAESLRKEGIDCLIAIGGNGTFAGALILDEEHDIPIVGAPGTIDNDLYGTDMTIGFDTACNTVIEAVDKLRDTAASHNRLFFVEVMGRNSGYIALNSYAGSDAEAVLIPEDLGDMDRLMTMLGKKDSKKKSSYIVIIAEGEESGNAFDIQQKVAKIYPHFNSRVTVLGHVQRGGRPSCIDRINASRMGMAAVGALKEGKRNVMAGIINNEIVYTSFKETIEREKPFRKDLLEMSQRLGLD
jgi:6-phosphofructokinase 1